MSRSLKIAKRDSTTSYTLRTESGLGLRFRFEEVSAGVLGAPRGRSQVRRPWGPSSSGAPCVSGDTSDEGAVSDGSESPTLYL